MCSKREAERSLRSVFPELVATGLLCLDEDGRDDQGCKSWSFEFRMAEDNGTEIRLGDGFVHATGYVEGLYGVEFSLDEYEAHEARCVPSEHGGKGDHCAPTCRCPCHTLKTEGR